MRSYVLVSPCRDEAEYLELSAQSVVEQDERPTLWVIVDDGSSDATPRLLRALSEQHDWIRVITRGRGGARALGGGVVEAFDAGLETVQLNDFDYVCKLDLDLILPRGYFAGLMDRMEHDPRLATVSGKPYFYRTGSQRQYERCGDENSVGMTKFYRVDAFQAIGGFVPQLMWDGIDCHTARMLGWRAASVSDLDLAFEHLRPMGSSDRGVLRGRRRHGLGQWLMGSSPAFVMASALLRLRDYPQLIGSLHMLFGYLRAAVRREPQYARPGFRAALRRYQHESLVLGKQRATTRWESRVQGSG